MLKKIHVKKNDMVLVLSGKDKGKKGKVLATIPKEGKVLVENVNMITKHEKPRSQEQPGGIIRKEAPIYASKVMHICNKCGKATRHAKKILENGQRTRYCKHCGETFND